MISTEDGLQHRMYMFQTGANNEYESADERINAHSKRNREEEYSA